MAQMNYKQMVAHFGGLSKAAKALGLKRQTVHMWAGRGRIPTRWQIKAVAKSEGRLKADRQARAEALEMVTYVAQGAQQRG